MTPLIQSLSESISNETPNKSRDNKPKLAYEKENTELKRSLDASQDQVDALELELCKVKRKNCQLEAENSKLKEEIEDLTNSLEERPEVLESTMLQPSFSASDQQKLNHISNGVDTILQNTVQMMSFFKKVCLN